MQALVRNGIIDFFAALRGGVKKKKSITQWPNK